MDSIPDDLLELKARFDQWRANRKYNAANPHTVSPCSDLQTSKS